MPTDGVKLSGAPAKGWDRVWTRLWRVPFGRRRCKEAIPNLSGKRTELAERPFFSATPRTYLQSDDDRSFFHVIIITITKGEYERC